jgi:hypothetical protein
MLIPTCLFAFLRMFSYEERLYPLELCFMFYVLASEPRFASHLVTL